MLRRDVFVLELLRFLEGGFERAVQRFADARLRGRTRLARQAAEDLVELGGQRLGRDAELLEHRDGRAFGLREHRVQQVDGLDRGVPAAGGIRLRLRERFLTLDGELVELHRAIS